MYAIKFLDPNFKDHKVVASVYNFNGEDPVPESSPLGKVSKDRDGLVIFPEGALADAVNSKLSVFPKFS